MKIVFLILGLIGSIYFYSSINVADETLDWSRTDAILNYFETPSYWRNKLGYEKECKTIVASYSYKYKRNDYSNNKVSLLPQSTMWAHQLEDLVKKEKWKQGEKTVIYLNPENPSEATMLRGVKGTGRDTWIGFIFCFLIFVSGLVGCLRSLYNFIMEPVDVSSFQE
jgi:hypothetical protein